MEPEYIAIIVTVSVLGGVIIIALIAVCIAKIVANKKLRRNFAKTQLYGDKVALQNANSLPSFVRYPAPEPYTPAPHDSEDNPWQFGYQHPPTVADALDNLTFPDPHLPQYNQRQPSNAQALQYRPSSVQNMPRRPSNAQDLPRRSSYVQDMPRRPSYVQAMPRSRSSYAPDMLRGPSNAQAGERRPSMVSHAAGRPTRRSSFHHHARQNKLWYNYLKEDPQYFTGDAIERNKKQPRVWHVNGNRSTPPSAPLHDPLRRENELPHQQQHQYHAATRWM